MILLAKISDERGANDRATKKSEVRQRNNEMGPAALSRHPHVSVVFDSSGHIRRSQRYLRALLKNGAGFFIASPTRRPSYRSMCAAPSMIASSFGPAAFV